MVSEEKFQAGEAYADPQQQSASDFLSDPVKVATDLLKDYSGIRSQASVQDIVGLIKELMNPGQPLDDKKG